MIWVEYRDERKFMGPWPAPVFCGIFSTLQEFRQHLPWWARQEIHGARAHGAYAWYGRYGEGWYMYQLGEEMEWYWPGIQVDEVLGPLANRSDMECPWMAKTPEPTPAEIMATEALAMAAMAEEDDDEMALIGALF